MSPRMIQGRSGGLIPAQASEATIEFLGQHFVPRRGQMTGLLGIGYDPLNDRVLSAAHTTRCGENLMSNFVGDNGVAWDPVNEEFWLISGDREVYRYDGDQPEILFTIAETILVPGVGIATVDTPEGLAVDEDLVYVLDAGPSDQRGELAANEWFKFTREGTPVSSSGATDFTAQLQAHFDAFGDCVVDGMTWIPPGSPFGEGLFLVAIEHSGIQVLDVDGFFVDRLLWQDQDLPPGSVPFGFAGIAVDPLRGDLYLVDNGSEVQVWERIDEEIPTSLIDPDSGLAIQFGGEVATAGWEGLVAVPVGAGWPGSTPGPRPGPAAGRPRAPGRWAAGCCPAEPCASAPWRGREARRRPAATDRRRPRSGRASPRRGYAGNGRRYRHSWGRPSVGSDPGPYRIRIVRVPRNDHAAAASAPAAGGNWPPSPAPPAGWPSPAAPAAIAGWLRSRR